MTSEERRVVTATLRWLLIRNQQGQDTLGQGLTQLEADADHSALLLRLLEGQEPLAAPPPGGQYDIIDYGYRLLSALELSYAHDFGSLDRGQGIDIAHGHWQVEKRLSEHAIMVSHPNAPGRWRLTYVGKTYFGAKTVERNGERFGEPWQGDGWVLRRIAG